MKKFYFLALVATVICFVLSSCGPKVQQARFENTNFASVTVEGSGQYGIKDLTTGQEILPQIYKSVGYYYSGFFTAQDDTGVQLFDVSGKCVIPAQAQINAKDGYFEFVGNKTSKGSGAKGIYVIKTGKTIINVYDALEGDGAGNFMFFAKGLYGVLNPEGETIIPGEYNQLIWDGKNYNAIKDKNPKRPYFDEKTKKINWTRAEAFTFDKDGKQLKKLTTAQAKKIFEAKK